MPYDFPANVVKTTDKFSAELRQFDNINADDIARLWKAYTTQSAVVRDVVVSRLENLFWRIWGNATIQQSLTGSVLANLFMAIHDHPSVHITNQTPSSKTATSKINNDNKYHGENQGSQPKNERKNPLPPILKKASDEGKSVPPSEPSSHKTTRIVVPEKQSQGPSRKNSKDTTNTENGKRSKPSATSNSTNATQKPFRKRPSFVANRSSSSRRRGVLIRRKSSQTSPVASPTVEETEDKLHDETKAQGEVRQEKQAAEATGPSISVKDSEISWRSMDYLKKFEEESRNAPTERAAETPGTSPLPTSFSASSVRHHRSPEDHSKAPGQENAQNGIVSDQSLVEQDFRSNFVQRQRQGSTFTTRNNSVASSLTTRLSSTNFREMLNTAEAAAAMQGKDSGGAARSLSPGPRYIILPKHDGSINHSSTMTSPTRKSDGRDRSRRPIIINTSSSSKVPQERCLEDEVPSSKIPAAVAVSESVISTSEQTTTGVFSVPKDSQELLGQQLTKLIQGKRNIQKTRPRVGS